MWLVKNKKKSKQHFTEEKECSHAVVKAQTHPDMVYDSLISDAHFYTVSNMGHVGLWCVVINAKMLDLFLVFLQSVISCLKHLTDLLRMTI